MSEQKQPLQKRAWDCLSAVNVNDKVEKKNGLSYLSWAWAWGVLMEYYPESNYVVHQDRTMADGSVMVGVTLTIRENGEEFTREMWLPVMNFNNKAIVNPNAVDINKAYMRCLAKAIAMCGLGHYIYAGDDLPEDEKTEKPEKPQSPKHASKPTSKQTTQQNMPSTPPKTPPKTEAKTLEQKLRDRLVKVKTIEELSGLYDSLEQWVREHHPNEMDIFANIYDEYQFNLTH